jgi:hypothetical protein
VLQLLMILPLQLMSNVAGAEITILTAGTQTELFHVETGTTSEAYVYTYSTDFNGDIQVFKQGYKPYWLASNAFSNSNQTITVNLRSRTGESDLNGKNNELHRLKRRDRVHD